MIRTALTALAVTLALCGTAAAMIPDTGGAIERPPIYFEGIDAIEAGDYAKGLEIMKSFVEEDPKDADAWTLVGYSLRKLKRFVDSEHAYQQALEADPKNPAGNAYVGILYLETGRVLEAEQRLDVLSEICADGIGCKARDTLREMIESYKKTGKTGADW